MRDLPKLPALRSRPDGRFRGCTGESVRSSTRLRAAATGMEKPGLPQRRALEVRSASETRAIAGGARVKNAIIVWFISASTVVAVVVDHELHDLLTVFNAG